MSAQPACWQPKRTLSRNLEVSATASHFERLRSGRVDTAETSSLHLDALRHLKQIKGG
jgi:phosphate:Na+ symporter